jgi:hypothetical protein
VEINRSTKLIVQLSKSEINFLSLILRRIAKHFHKNVEEKVLSKWLLIIHRLEAVFCVGLCLHVLMFMYMYLKNLQMVDVEKYYICPAFNFQCIKPYGWKKMYPMFTNLSCRRNWKVTSRSVPWDTGQLFNR